MKKKLFKAKKNWVIGIIAGSVLLFGGAISVSANTNEENYVETQIVDNNINDNGMDSEKAQLSDNNDPAAVENWLDCSPKDAYANTEKDRNAYIFYSYEVLGREPNGDMIPESDGFTQRDEENDGNPYPFSYVYHGDKNGQDGSDYDNYQLHGSTFLNDYRNVDEIKQEYNINLHNRNTSAIQKDLESLINTGDLRGKNFRRIVLGNSGISDLGEVNHARNAIYKKFLEPSLNHYIDSDQIPELTVLNPNSTLLESKGNEKYRAFDINACFDVECPDIEKAVNESDINESNDSIDWNYNVYGPRNDVEWYYNDKREAESEGREFTDNVEFSLGFDPLNCKEQFCRFNKNVLDIVGYYYHDGGSISSRRRTIIKAINGILTITEQIKNFDNTPLLLDDCWMPTVNLHELLWGDYGFAVKSKLLKGIKIKDDRYNEEAYRMVTPTGNNFLAKGETGEFAYEACIPRELNEADSAKQSSKVPSISKDKNITVEFIDKGTGKVINTVNNVEEGSMITLPEGYRAVDDEGLEVKAENNIYVEPIVDVGIDDEKEFDEESGGALGGLASDKTKEYLNGLVDDNRKEELNVNDKGEPLDDKGEPVKKDADKTMFSDTNERKNENAKKYLKNHVVTTIIGFIAKESIKNQGNENEFGLPTNINFTEIINDSKEDLIPALVDDIGHSIANNVGKDIPGLNAVTVAYDTKKAFDDYKEYSLAKKDRKDVVHKNGKARINAYHKERKTTISFLESLIQAVSDVASAIPAVAVLGVAIATITPFALAFLAWKFIFQQKALAKYSIKGVHDLIGKLFGRK